MDQKPSLKELQHYGVKGMRWGVRKERKAARAAAKAEEREHRAKVKDLKAQRRAKANSDIDKEFDEMGRKEQAAYAKIASQEAKQLAEIDATAKNRIDRMIGKHFVKSNAEALRMNVTSKIEDEYITKYKAEKNAQKKEKYQKLHEIEQKYLDRYEKEVSGKPFFEGLKISNRLDVEQARESQLAMLEIEARTGLTAGPSS